MPRLRAGLIVVLLGTAFAAPQDDPPPPGDTDTPVTPVTPVAAVPEAEKPADAEAVLKMAPAERARRLKRALTRLSEDLADVKTLTASFVQTKHLEVFGGTVESRGTVALAPPGRFAWSTVTPIRSELVTNGDKGLRRRTSRTGAVTETSFDLADDPATAATVAQVILWTRGDFAGAEATYTLSLVSERPLVVGAVPREERTAAVIRSVRLTFAEDPVHLSEVVLTEQTGDRTEIAFSDVRRNVEIPEGRFDVAPRREQ